MKKNFTLIAMIVFMNNILNGQTFKHFTYLFTGDTIYSNRIVYISKSFSNSYLLVDGKEIQEESVKFYQNQDGFFGNTKNLNFSETSSFTKRETSGNINLFKKESVTNTMVMGGNGMMMGSMGPNYFVDYYYNIEEFGDLKKANYKNLKTDLSSNMNSMFHLSKFKSAKQRETLLYGVGGVIMSLGVASLINKTSDVPQEETAKTGGSFAIIGLGFGTLITNYLTSVNKDKHIERAIEEFNK